MGQFDQRCPVLPQMAISLRFPRYGRRHGCRDIHHAGTAIFLARKVRGWVALAGDTATVGLAALALDVDQRAAAQRSLLLQYALHVLLAGRFGVKKLLSQSTLIVLHLVC